jgi:hypothetical protein
VPKADIPRGGKNVVFAALRLITRSNFVGSITVGRHSTHRKRPSPFPEEFSDLVPRHNHHLNNRSTQFSRGAVLRCMPSLGWGFVLCLRSQTIITASRLIRV